MANGQRRRVGAMRSASAVTLASVGLFTAMAGLGMQSWPLGAVGVATVVLAVALLVASQFRGADRAFVVGTAHVLEVTEAPVSLTHGRCEMHLQIEAPGHPPASVRVRDPRVPVAKWPEVGDILPVRVAVDDLRRVKVLWDETLTHTQRRQDYGDAEYEGVTAENEPIYDELQPRVYAPDFDHDHDRDDLTGYGDDEIIPEGPPLPQRRRTVPDRDGKPSPRPRRAVAEPTAGMMTVLEGQILADPLESPMRVDIIDFSQAPPPPTADVPPYTPPRQQASTFDGPPAEWPPQSDIQETAEPAAAPLPGEPAPEADPSTPDIASTGDGDRLADEDPVDPGEPHPAGGDGSVQGDGIPMLVADVDRSVAFYRDLLGFDELDSGRGNAVLASGSTRIVLRKADDLTPGNRRLTHLNLEVDDLDGVYRQLQERGVTFTYAPRVVNRGERLELWAAAFRDPDGHAVNLTEWRSRS